MASPLDEEYEEMLYTPVPLVTSRSHPSSLTRLLYSLKGPHKVAIDAIQKQIDLRSKETNELKSTQNSHVPISRLPAELLSEVFLYVVESDLREDDLGFALGTFGFRRACKRWNEVALGCPQLWARWAPGAFLAWGIFNTRSKGVPISLTWRPWYRYSRNPNDISVDYTIPVRIRTLDFAGTVDHLEDLLEGFGYSHFHFPIASSIRLHVTPYDEQEPKERTRIFFSLSFPKLSKLDLKNFLPDSSSPIFATSNLVSLKLGVPYGAENQYTRSQSLQILQRHSNLQELHLWQGGMPQVEPSQPLVPVILPRLVDLRLYGTAVIVAGFADLVDASSPLHNVVVDLESASTRGTLPPINAIKKILVLSYGCQELDYPRMAHHLTISSNSDKKSLVFNTKSLSTSAPYPASNFELRLNSVGSELAGEICLLFPLDHVREFATICVPLSKGNCRGIFKKMEDLLHLRIDNVELGPVMGALCVGDQLEGVHKEAEETTWIS